MSQKRKVVSSDQMILYDNLWLQIANFVDSKTLSKICQISSHYSFLQTQLYQRKQWILNNDIPMKAYPYVRILFIDDVPNKPIPHNVTTVSITTKPSYMLHVSELPNSVEEIVLSSGDFLQKWPIHLKKLILFYYNTTIQLPPTLTSCVFIQCSMSVKQMILQTLWNNNMKFAKVHLENNQIIAVEICQDKTIELFYVPLETNDPFDQFYVRNLCEHSCPICPCKPWLILNVMSLEKLKAKLLKAKPPSI